MVPAAEAAQRGKNEVSSSLLAREGGRHCRKYLSLVAAVGVHAFGEGTHIVPPSHSQGRGMERVTARNYFLFCAVTGGREKVCEKGG